MKPFASIFALVALFLVSPAPAHDEPTSYADLRPDADGLTVSVLASTTDVAHYLPAVEPGMLLVPEAVTAQRSAMETLIRSRLTLTADGTPLVLTGQSAEAIPDKRDVRLTFRAPWPGPPSSLRVRCDLFPYDPRHRTFLTVHREATATRTLVFPAAGDAVEVMAGPAPAAGAVFSEYARMGIHHIFIGPDHILFVIGLLLLGGSTGRLLKIVTAFTVAHSITLGLATFEIVRIPASIIEPVIALSIVVVGLHACLPRHRRDPRMGFAFLFGLIHGFGFAFVLQEMELPPAAMGLSLFAFNAGVEAGQACIVLIAAPLLAFLRRRHERFSGHFVTACAALVAMAGTFWFVERVLS